LEVDYAELWYVLVEEMVGDAVGLRVAAWPRADPEGLPVFADPEGEVELGADRDELQRRVDRLRRPQPGSARSAQAALRRRRLALGDVFAADIDARALAAAARSEQVASSGWLRGLFDVTADARDAARQIFYQAVTAPLSGPARQEIMQEQMGRRGR
jgi:hypothetical protein